MNSLPDMNLSRSLHGGTCHGDAVYFGFGVDDSGAYLSSVETLSMGMSGATESEAWSLINIHEITQRKYQS